jgi:hypothetical protein
MMLLTESTTSASPTSASASEARANRSTQHGIGIGAERRRGLRVRQHRPIKIFEPVTHKYFGGQTEDVSATGLRVELPLSTPVRPGHIVNVHVGLNYRGEALANRRSMIPARVVWVGRRADLARGHLTAGVEFISSTAAHLDAA